MERPEHNQVDKEPLAALRDELDGLFVTHVEHINLDLGDNGAWQTLRLLFRGASDTKSRDLFCRRAHPVELAQATGDARFIGSVRLRAGYSNRSFLIGPDTAREFIYHERPAETEQIDDQAIGTLIEELNAAENAVAY